MTSLSLSKVIVKRKYIGAFLGIFIRVLGCRYKKLIDLIIDIVIIKTH